MTPAEYELMHRAMRATMAKATNMPRGDDSDVLAERMAKAIDVPPALAGNVMPRDAVVVRAAMRAVAPYIHELRAEVEELRARVDELDENVTR